MSHHTSLSVKYSGTSVNFPPVQSCFELSLGKASSDAAGRGIYFATSLHHVWCVTDRHSVAIALWCVEKKNQHIGPLPHPLPSPCLALPDCTRSLITSQIVQAITSSFFVRFV